jgi:hypothetical protein
MKPMIPKISQKIIDALAVIDKYQINVFILNVKIGIDP